MSNKHGDNLSRQKKDKINKSHNVQLYIPCFIVSIFLQQNSSEHSISFECSNLVIKEKENEEKQKRVKSKLRKHNTIPVLCDTDINSNVIFIIFIKIYSQHPVASTLILSTQSLHYLLQKSHEIA